MGDGGVPVGASPIVDVTLGEKGGTVGCTLTVRGKHVQRATATGAFGRTACGGEPPVSEESTAPEGVSGPVVDPLSARPPPA